MQPSLVFISTCIKAKILVKLCIFVKRQYLTLIVSQTVPGCVVDLHFGTYKYKRHRRADGPWLWLAESWEENNADWAFSDVWFCYNIFQSLGDRAVNGGTSHDPAAACFPHRPGNPDKFCSGIPRFQRNQGVPHLFNSSNNNLLSHRRYLFHQHH